jgi:hypothetical protein
MKRDKLELERTELISQIHQLEKKLDGWEGDNESYREQLRQLLKTLMELENKIKDRKEKNMTRHNYGHKRVKFPYFLSVLPTILLGLGCILFALLFVKEHSARVLAEENLVVAVETYTQYQEKIVTLEEEKEFLIKELQKEHQDFHLVKINFNRNRALGRQWQHVADSASAAFVAQGWELEAMLVESESWDAHWKFHELLESYAVAHAALSESIRLLNGQ